MIKVWTDATEAGLLDRHGERGSTFAYLPDVPPGARKDQMLKESPTVSNSYTLQAQFRRRDCFFSAGHSARAGHPDLAEETSSTWHR